MSCTCGPHDGCTECDAPPTFRDECEALARRFHYFYERLAPEFGYKTREESAVPWEQVPAQNRELMIAVAHEIMRDAPPQARAALGAQERPED